MKLLAPLFGIMLLVIFPAAAAASDAATANDREIASGQLPAELRRPVDPSLLLKLQMTKSNTAGVVSKPEKKGISLYLNDMPKDGVVPDERTAIAVATIYLSIRYGGSFVAGQTPLRVTGGNDEYWLVSGTLGSGSRKIEENGIHARAGGVAEIAIRKSDGAALGMAIPK